MPGPSLRIPRVSGLVMGQPGGGAPSPNPNLLLWSEEAQQAVWVTAGSVTVTVDAGPDAGGGNTADDIAFGSSGASILQTSATAVTTGATAQTTVTLSGSAVRRSVSGTFDSTVYVLSVWLEEPADSGAVIRLRLDRSGGFLRAGLVDLGDLPTVRVWGWKLETPDLTAYVKREGV